MKALGPKMHNKTFNDRLTEKIESEFIKNAKLYY